MDKRHSANSPRGLIITGTDTEVGKTHVAAAICRDLTAQGHRVGAYKPVASGCWPDPNGQLVSDDAQHLWRAIGQRGTLEAVCPQRFEAPLAPHVAARREGRRVDVPLLTDGLRAWTADSDIVIVEGAGGLLSPLADEGVTLLDLAQHFGYPLLIVSPNRLGTINHTRLTIEVARAAGVAVVGMVLNTLTAQPDASAASNPADLQQFCGLPLLATLGWRSSHFDTAVDWWSLAAP